MGVGGGVGDAGGGAGGVLALGCHLGSHPGDSVAWWAPRPAPKERSGRIMKHFYIFIYFYFHFFFLTPIHPSEESVSAISKRLTLILLFLIPYFVLFRG